VAKLCEHLKKILPNDEGVDFATSGDYREKTMNCVLNYKFLVFQGLYGNTALLGWLDFLCKREQYEIAGQLVEYIHSINKNKTKNKLATSL